MLSVLTKAVGVFLQHNFAAVPDKCAVVSLDHADVFRA